MKPTLRITLSVPYHYTDPTYRVEVMTVDSIGQQEEIRLPTKTLGSPDNALRWIVGYCHSRPDQTLELVVNIHDLAEVMQR